MRTEPALTLSEALTVIANMTNEELPPGDRVRGDRRDGRVYEYDKDIVLGLQVALITSRPLLLSGPPGCGKSSLASYVARNLGVALYEYVVTDDASSDELLYDLDVIQRLNDASGGHLRTDEFGRSRIVDYVQPGPLWWALNPTSAVWRNADPDDRTTTALPEPDRIPGYTPVRPGAVLLIDEIDKADSSFGNGLLVPLGSRQFTVPGIDAPIHAGEDQPSYSPLVIVTTNNERDLPEAFVRRCIALPIGRPDAEKLKAAAALHHPVLRDRPDLAERVGVLAKRFEAESTEARPASTAEFLDLIGALLELDLPLDSEDWHLVERLVVEKPNERGRAGPFRMRGSSS
jgi:MoxR-like ATPase